MKVVSANITQVLSACRLNLDGFLDKPQIKYLGSYLSDIGAKTAVIEFDYIDKDYLEDYARYYANCFLSYGRRCIRVHFFSKAYAQEEVEKIITCDFVDGLEDFKVAYLGFVILRPLQQTIIGRTCLVPYAEGDSGRHYKALQDVSVSFFGRNLQIRCMPFQEQDTAVAACATCALWSAFRVTSEFFKHAVYSPGRITAMATEHALSNVRSLPNRSGLTRSDMLYAIRHVGLDPVVIPIVRHNGLDNYTKAIMLGNIYAYLNLGISVIALGSIVDSSGKVLGGHAITVNGYHLDPSQAVNGVSVSGLTALNIDKLYVHDDQVGPYARAIIVPMQIANIGVWVIKYTDGVGRADENRIFVPDSLVVPVHKKIRLSYEEVWGCAYQFDKIVRIVPDILPPISWDITLTNVNVFKDEIRKRSDITDNEKLILMTKSLPKYLWVLRMLNDNSESCTFCVDATDSGQGLNVVASIVPRVLRSIVDAIFDRLPFQARTPLLCAAKTQQTAA